MLEMTAFPLLLLQLSQLLAAWSSMAAASHIQLDVPTGSKGQELKKKLLFSHRETLPGSGAQFSHSLPWPECSCIPGTREVGSRNCILGHHTSN